MLMLRNKEIEGDSTVSCKLMEFHLRFCNLMSELLLHIQVGRPCPTGKVELALRKYLTNTVCAALLQEIDFSITNDKPNDGNIDMVDWKRTAAALQEIHASFNQESESLGQVHLQLPSIASFCRA